jgi:hypothetical protein
MKKEPDGERGMHSMTTRSQKRGTIQGRGKGRKRTGKIQANGEGWREQKARTRPRRATGAAEEATGQWSARPRRTTMASGSAGYVTNPGTYDGNARKQK